MRWRSRPSAPSGCAGRQGESPPVDGVDATRARDVVEAALAGRPTTLARPRRDAGAARGVRHPDGAASGSRRASTDAVDGGRELGYPVVVKTAAPGVHKTDVGGVALDLRDEGQVRAAAERIGTPVLVQPYLGGGVELLAGVVQDPVFGPLVAFGPGGALAELIGDAGFRLAPLTERRRRRARAGGQGGTARRRLPRCRARGRAGARRPRAPARLGLPRTCREVAELDLNPILAGPAGCVAVDARVRVRAQRPERRIKGW